MNKLFFTLGVILFGLSLGYGLRLCHESGRLRLPVDIARLRVLLQKVGILGFMSVSFFFAVWILRIPDARLAAMPLIGLGSLVLGGLASLAVSKAMGHDRLRAGSMFACGSFTNIGAIGALVCLVFLGEEGFALVALFKLLEETYYYAVGFPILRFMGTGHGGEKSFLGRLKVVFTDEFVVTILSAVFLGAVLNLAGVKRPAFFAQVNSVIVPVGIVLLLTSVGLGLRLTSIREYWREALAIMGIKQFLVPVAAVFAAYGLGYGDMLGGLPLHVVLVCSSMPVAFNGMIAPSLYGLDLDLASACWLVSMASLLWLLPLLRYVMELF